MKAVFGIVLAALSMFGFVYQGKVVPSPRAAAVTVTFPKAPVLLTAASVAQPVATSVSKPATSFVHASPSASAGAVLGTSTMDGLVTQSQLQAAIDQLNNSLRKAIYSTANNVSVPYSSGGVTNNIALSNKIDRLSGVNISGGSISNTSVSGLTGLTTSDIGGFAFANAGDFTPSYNIAAWGDSLTIGVGGTPYPTQLATLFKNGRYVYNGGYGALTSTQIATRMLAATDKYGYTAIIWAGRNNYTDPTTVKADIASMVMALGHNRYIILSVMNGNYASEYQGQANYNTITQLNSDLQSLYPNNYIDIREYIIQHGLTDAGITPTAQDLIDIGNDVPPTSLTTDGLHLTAAGYAVVAKQVYNFITAHLETSAQSTKLLNLSNLAGIFSTPPAIGAGTPNAGTFTDLTANFYNTTGGVLLYASSTNVAVGLGALPSFSTTGTSNSAVGYLALNANTTGQANTAVGYEALLTNTTGSNNTAVGFGALLYNTTGSSNTANGSLALQNNTTGKQNIAVGQQALQHNTTANANTANGWSSMYTNVTGANNVANGYASLYLNTTGSSNVADGASALYYNVSATSTVAVGSSAGGGTAAYNNQGGVFVGTNAGNSLSTNSDYNTLIGFKSGFNITTGSGNILIGANPNTGGNHLSTGGNNIGIGYNIVFPGGTSASNQLNIGNFIFGTGLTATSTSTSIPGTLTGNLGIGTTTPWRTLSVNGTVGFAGLTSDTADSKVLCLTAANEVVANAGTSCITSSQRFKNTIVSLDVSSGLSEVLKLNPVSFQYNSDIGIPATQVGFIAEQVQQIDPRLVVLDSSNAPFTVRYENLTAVLAKAIQDIASVSGAFKDALVAWLGDETNGIGKLFAGEVHTKQLCVAKSDGSEVCITGDELASVLAGSNQQSVQISAPTPPTISGTTTPHRSTFRTAIQRLSRLAIPIPTLAQLCTTTKATIYPTARSSTACCQGIFSSILRKWRPTPSTMSQPTPGAIPARQHARSSCRRQALLLRRQLPHNSLFLYRAPLRAPRSGCYRGAV